MNISLKQLKNKIYLKLEGELGIRDASGLKEVLLKQLTKEKPIEINLEGMSKIDTAGLQLLYAARETAVQKGKVFSLRKPSVAFLEALKLAGLAMQIQED